MERENGSSNNPREAALRGNSLLRFLPPAKLIRLRGYSGGNEDYQKAKTPVDSWQLVAGLDPEKAQEWLNQRGWLGLIIPEKFILIDVDDKGLGRILRDCFMRTDTRCIIIETPNGYQFFFKDTNRVRFQSAKKLTAGGLTVDYRLANKGYTVLPIEDMTTDRHIVHLPSGENLDPMPLMFFPVRTAKKDDETPEIPIIDGRRNDTLFREHISRLRALNERHRCGLIDDDMLTILREVNHFLCLPPLEEKEIEEIFKSSLRYTSPAIVRVAVDEVDKVNVDVGGEIFPTGEFPIEVYPAEFLSVVESVSRSVDVEPGMIVSSMNAILSGAIGNSLRISPTYGFDVPPFIWQVVVAPTGYGKSPVIRTLTRHIDDLQIDAREDYEEQHRAFTQMISAARKNGSDEIPPEPHLRRYFVSDVTIEALANVFADTPRGTLIRVDELSGFILGLNQYKRGRGNDKQHILELFDCQPWAIERKGISRLIPYTGAAMLGGIQTEIMPKVFASDSFLDGLLPRFLFYVAQERIRRFNPDGLKQTELAYWESLLDYCYNIPLMSGTGSATEANKLLFDPDGVAVFKKFHDLLHERRTQCSKHMQTFIPKLITYCVKLAGLLHVIKSYPADIDFDPIGGDTVNDAINLVFFYAGQANRVAELYGRKDDRLLTESMLLTCLAELRCDVKEGQLPLSHVQMLYNSKVPPALRIHQNKRLSSMLKNLGFQTKRGTGGYYYLLWDHDLFSKLSRLKTSTFSTLSTPVQSVVTGKLTAKVDVSETAHEEPIITMPDKQATGTDQLLENSEVLGEEDEVCKSGIVPFGRCTAHKMMFHGPSGGMEAWCPKNNRWCWQVEQEERSFEAGVRA